MQDQKEESDFRFQTNQKLQNLQFSIDMINKTLNQCLAVQGTNKVELDIKMAKNLDSCMVMMKDFRSILDDFEMKITDHYSTLSRSIDDVKPLYITRKDHDGEIASLKAVYTELKKEYHQFCQQVNLLVQRSTSDNAEKIKAFIQEIQSKPSPIADLKKQLEEKLEMVALNGTNSVLRSTNNEKQVALIEKKIEQIFLLIKQMELGK